jgi:glycosyltransferase involved in cell wall biosynthesis
MITVAYLANEFPVAVEPYVVEEITELRKRGVQVIPFSARRPRAPFTKDLDPIAEETLYLQSLAGAPLGQVTWFAVKHLRELIGWVWVGLRQKREPLGRRVRAIAHTALGCLYALLLRDKGVRHIHVHHGYFSAWIAMVAARMLGISYSMTLHGSDLLLHHAFLDLKLHHCKFCLTVSEFNRQHLLKTYPTIPADKILVQRMGVKTLGMQEDSIETERKPRLVMLAVGRLHPVKDHAFLLRACRELKTRGLDFVCLIAGEGPERASLEKLVRELDLQSHVTLLGHVPRARLETYYSTCDLVVLTSRSEGVPLVLMEAMAHGRTVLAPAITGIPELVVDGVTGFLYKPGSLRDFVPLVEAICHALPNLDSVRRRARQHVLEHFNRTANLAAFADSFPTLVAGVGADHHENPLLQQI